MYGITTWYKLIPPSIFAVNQCFSIIDDGINLYQVVIPCILCGVYRFRWRLKYYFYTFMSFANFHYDRLPILSKKFLSKFLLKSKEKFSKSKEN